MLKISNTVVTVTCPKKKRDIWFHHFGFRIQADSHPSVPSYFWPNMKPPIEHSRSSPLSAAKWLRSLHLYPIPIASPWPWISTSPLPPVPRGGRTRRDFESLRQWRPRNCHWVAMQRAPGGAQKALEGFKKVFCDKPCRPMQNLSVSKTQKP